MPADQPTPPRPQQTPSAAAKSPKPARPPAAAAERPAPPERFSEAAFAKYVVDLCDSGQHQAASTYFLQNVGQLLAARVNPQEKINNLLYLTRMIQFGGNTKHGYQKMLRKVSAVESTVHGFSIPKGGAFVDFGCGAHDPLALSTYYYLNGVGSVYGVDLLPPRNDRYSALSMYDLCANIRSFPARYCREGVAPATILERLEQFDVGAFERGDFAGGFAKTSGKVTMINGDIARSGLTNGSCSLMASFAVLEHVDDIDGVSKTLHDLLLPGGLAYNFVDLADHRMYGGSGKFGPLSFLTEETAPANMNRLRAPQITQALKAAGFEILVDRRNSAELTDEIKGNLQPQFRRFTDEEVSTVKQVLLVRKPG